MPGRKGTYLCIEQGSVSYAVARFRNPAEAQRFIEFAKEADRQGLRIAWRGNIGEEGDSEKPA